MAEPIDYNATFENYKLQESTIAALRNELAVSRRNEELYKTANNELRHKIDVQAYNYDVQTNTFNDLYNDYEKLQSNQSYTSNLEEHLEKQAVLIDDLTKTVIKLTSLLPENDK